MIYPALQLLAQGYLMLDWPDDYSNAWAAIDDFVAHEPVARQLPHEVDQLIGTTSSDDSLSALLIGEIGSGYLPEADGFTMKTWLCAVRERVQAALGG
ncbi:contact-dependent growth inhibition system immunity protein [Nocardioides sp. BYT-33-1]|uniref:contact-dependent growth inhibition system immunity protein n=1 Tax=Nocardioides sp. BYT-33-1 TaxID=3416952 RepID=UPI003F53BC8A